MLAHCRPVAVRVAAVPDSRAALCLQTVGWHLVCSPPVRLALWALPLFRARFALPLVFGSWLTPLAVASACAGALPSGGREGGSRPRLARGALSSDGGLASCLFAAGSARPTGLAVVSGSLRFAPGIRLVVDAPYRGFGMRWRAAVRWSRGW